MADVSLVFLASALFVTSVSFHTSNRRLVAGRRADGLLLSGLRESGGFVCELPSGVLQIPVTSALAPVCVYLVAASGRLTYSSLSRLKHARVARVLRAKKRNESGSRRHLAIGAAHAYRTGCTNNG